MRRAEWGEAEKSKVDRNGVDSSERRKKGLPRMIRNCEPVLVVDEDQAAARSLADSLEKSGFSVFVARDGSHAMSILEFRAFAVVIVGIDPPLDRRLDLISWSRDICPRPRLVAVGSEISRTEEHAILSRGANLLLRKPVDVTQLVDFIKRTRTRSSFTGKVQDVDILEYIQFVLLGGKQTILEVTSSVGTRGRIYLFDGHIVHAECGVLKGLQALYRCLCFREGNFLHKPWQEPEQMTINKPGELLLMESARMRDEVWGESDEDD